ncbi:DksA/TraR family C4-type zinc finger protein [Shewanella nanhaiensis]|uniref:DksA/TraR family C4-type zinc finger protein n=1 Tax=Shewanella nanhaiensis TaxID=2864872 RepID=A0ABS7E690_9GAMM|nr:DksA/TraR family C4-type zinc finger protein [Shewanella nanhaiensis]MBW8184527.1 DksA/TraR family C4-type zinc finger protein [Shewanella nanhaiensis]
MAGGWSRDGAVQDQIDNSVDDGVAQARSRLPVGQSLLYCEECDCPIPQARREAVIGVRLCVSCQQEADKQFKSFSNFNRRAGKDSQLR